MQTNESAQIYLFNPYDAEQFLCSAAVICDTRNQTIVDDQWYENHLKIYFDLCMRFPGETAILLEYLYQN